MKTNPRVIPLLAWLAGSAALVHAQDKITYDDHVVPILKANCFKCHNQDKTKADLDLSSYSALMAGGSSGPSVVAGNPDSSFLYTTMNHSEEPFMPEKSPKRPDKELEVIFNWIKGGLLENNGSIALMPQKPSIDLSLNQAPSGKPEGPPPMPEDLLLQPVITSDRANAVTTLASSPWAPLIAISGQQQVVLYNSDNYQPAGILPFPEGEALNLMFSRNAQLLLAGGGKPGSSGRVVVWSIKDGARLLEVGDDFDVIMAADISGDQALIATGGTDKYIKVYSTNENKKIHQIKKHTEWVSALAFSPDAVLLATGDRNGNLYIWEGETMQQFYELRGHKGKITGVSWRADSNVLASSSEDGTVKLWNMHDGKEIKSFSAHGGGALSVNYSMDGKIVTAGRDKLVRVWGGDGAKLKEFSGFTDLPLSATFTHDSKKVVSGDWTGNAIVWDIESQKEIARMAPNPPNITTRISQLEKQIKEQADKYAHLSAEAKKQTDALNNFTAEVEKQKQAVATLSSQQKMAEGEMNEAKKVLASLPKSTDLAPMQTQIQAATEKRKQAEAAVQVARKTIDPLQKTLTEKQKPVIDAPAVAAAEKALAEAPNDEEKAKRQAHMEAVKKGVVNQEAVKQAQQQLDQAKQKVVAAEKTFNDANAALNTANQNMAKTKADNEERAKNRAATQKRLDEINQRLASLINQIPPAQKLQKDAETKRNDQATKTDVARKAADAAKADPAPLQKQIAFWKLAEFNIQVHAAQHAHSEKQREKMAYERAAREAAEAAQKAGSDAASNKAAFEKLKAEYQKQKQQIAL